MTPTFYSLSAIPMDGVDGLRLNCSTTTETGTMISLIVGCLFPLDRIYSVNIWGFGCFQHSISDDIELSTHRVRINSIRSLRPGKLQITGIFLNGSEVAGFLAIVHSSRIDSDVRYYLVPKQPNQLNFKAVLPGLSSGLFAVSVFAVGKDNKPFHRAVGFPKNVTVKGSQKPGKTCIILGGGGGGRRWVFIPTF